MKLKYRIIIIVFCVLFTVGATLFSALYPRNKDTIPPTDNTEVKRIIGFQSQTQLETSFRQLGWLQ